MTSRERVIKTLNHQPLDRVPRDLWVSWWIRTFHPNKLDEVKRRFPLDIEYTPTVYGKSDRATGDPTHIGYYVDEWGSKWRVAEQGVTGEVCEPAIANASDVAHYKPPFELLDNSDITKINEVCSNTKCFVKGASRVRLFERMQFLRGTENLLIDIAYDTKELCKLIEMLHEFYCRELEILAKADVDGAGFLDDWGAQTSLLISPDIWRAILKPLYKDYCDILHDNGKYVFVHSDGYIAPLFPDLIEIGVDAVNSQLFCMDIEELGKQFSGKITFWGEIDRQNILPFGTEEDVRNAVKRVRSALGGTQGGIIAQCEWGKDVSFENIAAVFDEWNKTF